MQGSPRRILFDVNHPAQVHLFKHAIAEIRGRGHETLVVSRDKEITLELLDTYGIDHEPLSAVGDSSASLVREWLARAWRLLGVAREFEPDVIVARPNPPAIYVAQLLGCRTVMFKDTILPSRLVRALLLGPTMPFVDDVCAPPSFDLPYVTGRVHDLGFQELAYLHPDRFEPDPDRLRTHGIDPEEPYYVVRFAGWDAYHDVGNGGWSRAGMQELVSVLAEHGTVHITSEADLPQSVAEHRLTLPPHLIHDLLYYADLTVGDSQTMTTESALLGTPVVRVNSKVGDHDSSNFVELERRGLVFSYRDEREALGTVRDLVTTTDGTDWEQRRQGLVADGVDVTAFMVDLLLAEDPETVTLPAEADRPLAEVPGDPE